MIVSWRIAGIRESANAGVAPGYTAPLNEGKRMEKVIIQFKKFAGFITENVKSRITSEMTNEEAMTVIHEEIISYFNKQQQMTHEYISFGQDARSAFASAMYDLLQPLAAAFKPGSNPLYAEYVKASGKTGALNFITKA